MAIDGPAVMVKVESIRVDKAGRHDASTNQWLLNELLYIGVHVRCQGQQRQESGKESPHPIHRRLTRTFIHACGAGTSTRTPLARRASGADICSWVHRSAGTNFAIGYNKQMQEIGIQYRRWHSS